jgi:hypothetical protein
MRMPGCYCLHDDAKGWILEGIVDVKYLFKIKHHEEYFMLLIKETKAHYND